MIKRKVKSIIKFFIPPILFKLYGFFKTKINFIKDKNYRADYYRIINNFIRHNSNFNKSSPCVVIWEFGGFTGIFERDSIIAVALNLRGYKTHVIICDGVTKACIQRNKEASLEVWDTKCDLCVKQMLNVAIKYNFCYSFASEYIDRDKIKELEILSNNIDVSVIKNYRYLSVAAGEFAYASFLRYRKGYPIEYDKFKEEERSIFRKYFHTSLVNTYIANQVTELLKPLSIFTSHGCYSDYAPPVYLSIQKKINCISWTSGFGGYHCFYSRPINNKFSYRGIDVENWQKREKKPLKTREKKILDKFIKNRYFNNKSMDISFRYKPENNNSIREKLKIYNNNSIVCLFTHLNWDAIVDFSTMIFNDSDEWVIESIQQMIKIKNVNWLIRIHPAERIHGTLYSVGENIENTFKKLPNHIKIIWPWEEINTYSIYNLIDAGITIFGTIGVELPLFGKPVIVAGDAHFSNKGFTIDAKTKDEYFDILKKAAMIKPLEDNQINYARLYAYSYFIQRQVPLNVINKSQGQWGAIDLRQLNKLLPGKDYAMDKICEGIIKGKDVILE